MEDGSDFIQTAEEFEKDFGAEFKAANKEIGRFNLALFGRTGAGKSTLVNAVFGEEKAETGIGRPVTQYTNYHVLSNEILGFYDCKGFETGQSSEELSTWIRREIELMWCKDEKERLHVVWFVMSAKDKRIDEAQKVMMREIKDLGVPIIIVLTHTDLNAGELPVGVAKAFADSIADEVGELIFGGYPIFVQSILDQDYPNQPIHGLEGLLEATFQAAPEGARTALIAAQQIDFKRKRDSAETIIAVAATGAATVAAIPIPFADAPIILSVQVAMMAKIAAQYGLLMNNSHLVTMARIAMFSGGAVSVVGRGLAQLIKLIPGAGTIAGILCNAAIATTLTTGVGYAWIAVCEHLASLDSKERDLMVRQTELITTLFKTSFTENAKSIDISTFKALKKSA